MGRQLATGSTRDLILREASQLFADRGFHGTSTRDIADAVGIRQPSLFHHFATKRDIMAALQELDLQPSLALLDWASTADGSPAARLYCTAYLDVRRFLASDYDFTGTTTAAVLNDPSFSEASAAYDRIQDAQTALIGEGVASGQLISIDPAFANRAVDWTIDGLLIDATRRTEMDVARYAELLASFVVRSLLEDTGQLEGVRTEAMALVSAHEAADGRHQ